MNNKVYFITGVSGSGKSTLGQKLAHILGIDFRDGDDFHPESNITKMSSGMPLTDEDRAPWLASIAKDAALMVKNSSVIYACSALKEMYRKTLTSFLVNKQYEFFHLQAPQYIISERLQSRERHFMPSSLLASQYETYEAPSQGHIIDVTQSNGHCLAQMLNIAQPIKSDIGLIGLGVMGTALARNIASKGYTISLYNRYVAGKEEGIAVAKRANNTELKAQLAFEDIIPFVASLSAPRKIILMVNAGQAIDSVIQSLLPILDKGDLIIDGGNSHYQDTRSRAVRLLENEIQFIGCGISGGEEGALKGPAIMPGGTRQAYQMVSQILEDISAKNDEGQACCNYIGKSGSGHFVKMVHNGIEYAEMQLIAEIHSIYHHTHRMSHLEISDIFEQWSKGIDRSYLLDITINILRHQDEQGYHILDNIVDQASNKGTGAWTTIAAAQLGVAIPTLTAALYARYTSSDKSGRLGRSKEVSIKESKSSMSDILPLYRLCRIVNHIQGFNLIREASSQYQWDINMQELTQVWSGGCIIQSKLLPLFKAGFEESEDLFTSLTILEALHTILPQAIQAYSGLTTSSIPLPCISNSIDYLKAVIQAESNANMIQAQRDYFGAHTFLRKDDPHQSPYHHDWQTL